ncbi:MAG: hemerythrin domain-containing protein [Thermaerobacter sp.]|nr:hemerythrin domain-containing protein [Thermaerobacter sp.]
MSGTNSRLVADKIRAHHAAMVAQLSQSVSRVLDAVALANNWEPARQEVVAYIDQELLPHAVAEESTIYASARQFAPLRGLVASLIFEHVCLGRLRNALAVAQTGLEAVSLASAFSHLFDVHAQKEDQFVVQDLENRVDVDLAGILGSMRQLLSGAP